MLAPPLACGPAGCCCHTRTTCQLIGLVGHVGCTHRSASCTEGVQLPNPGHHVVTSGLHWSLQVRFVAQPDRSRWACLPEQTLTAYTHNAAPLNSMLPLCPSGQLVGRGEKAPTAGTTAVRRGHRSKHTRRQDTQKGGLLSTAHHSGAHHQQAVPTPHSRVFQVRL